MILKILEREAWQSACRDGHYYGSPDDVRDGFIHFSAPHQVVATAAKYFKGKRDLVIVAFDEAALGDALKWEPSRGGDLFPHLYAPLPTARALWERPLPLADDGMPVVPGDVLK
ncbi:DUF952 domain-containing protein [Hyphomicrobium sp.]|uniref:DUF952 domain-containing protein n=1 Tax=Hyphomicrobium sp. TaxID=82 RepID=UPI002E3665C0|nr:DUF952 domain-containing protein [Hyphomicrobium sp.]HEX2839775.1 DUF952 domain-containing protein [Hyphomicrobium sp.]